ncbi:MAG: hypothetical protein Q8L90_04905, partial [Bacteroidota bacterium]|nr:hypothetical protein [Bacteroidota bacterium]
MVSVTEPQLLALDEGTGGVAGVGATVTATEEQAFDQQPPEFSLALNLYVPVEGAVYVRAELAVL